MNIYKNFAYIYDDLMEGTPYDEWLRFLLSHKFTGNKILETGCGTSTMAIALAKKGFNVTATDISEDMLTVSRQKACDERVNNIKFLAQDMKNLEINDKFDVIMTFCDGINYLLNENELRKFFLGVKNVCSKGAKLFIEFSTRYKLKNILGNSTIKDENDDISFIWENRYDDDNDVLRLKINFCVACGAEDERINFSEEHVQKAWSVSDVERVAGDYFTILQIIDSEKTEVPVQTSQRCLIVLERDE